MAFSGVTSGTIPSPDISVGGPSPDRSVPSTPHTPQSEASTPSTPGVLRFGGTSIDIRGSAQRAVNMRSKRPATLAAPAAAVPKIGGGALAAPPRVGGAFLSPLPPVPVSEVSISTYLEGQGFTKLGELTFGGFSKIYRLKGPPGAARCIFKRMNIALDRQDLVHKTHAAERGPHLAPHFGPMAIRIRVIYQLMTGELTETPQAGALIVGMIMPEMACSLRDLFLDKQLLEPMASYIGLQIATTLLTARDNSVVHRDLKLDNVMVDPLGKIWVIDFDTARMYPLLNEHVETPVGGDGYLAPERQFGVPVTNPFLSDLYSLGAILERFVVGPRAQGIEGEIRPVGPEGAISDLRSLVARMKMPDPQKRISLEEVISHLTRMSAPAPEGEAFIFDAIQRRTAARIVRKASQEAVRAIHRERTVATFMEKVIKRAVAASRG